MTIQEKIASLPHINTIKDKVKDVMWFKTDNPNIVFKVNITWERIDIRDRAKEKARLLQEKQLLENEVEIRKAETEAMIEIQANNIQSIIDDIEKDHEQWQ